jgi:phytoene/squalene synthetase
MPVGRFVLDVHGEARTTWPASDALCKALQVLNHLQDCAKDYRTLDRVYLPADILASHGIGVEALGAPTASPALRACLAHLSDRSAQLVRDSTPLPNLIADWRLGLEVAAIQRLAATLLERLKHRDPLGEPVHLGRAGFVTTAAIGAMGGLIRRLIRKHPARVSEETRL